MIQVLGEMSQSSVDSYVTERYLMERWLLSAAKINENGSDMSEQEEDEPVEDDLEIAEEVDPNAMDVDSEGP